MYSRNFKKNDTASMRKDHGCTCLQGPCHWVGVSGVGVGSGCVTSGVGVGELHNNLACFYVVTFFFMPTDINMKN